MYLVPGWLTFTSNGSTIRQHDVRLHVSRTERKMRRLRRDRPTSKKPWKLNALVTNAKDFYTEISIILYHEGQSIFCTSIPYSLTVGVMGRDFTMQFAEYRDLTSHLESNEERCADCSRFN